MSLRDLYALREGDEPELGEDFEKFVDALRAEDVFTDPRAAFRDGIEEADPADVERWIAGLWRIAGRRALRPSKDWAYQSNWPHDQEDPEEYWVDVGEWDGADGWVGPVYRWTRADGWRVRETT